MYPATATLITSLIAICVTAYFAWQQKEIAKEKLRQDLFDRRWAVFNSVLDFYPEMIGWKGTEEQERVRDRLFRATRQSEFLFSQESEIAKVMNELNDSGMKVIGLKSMSSTTKGDPDTIIERQRELDRIQINVFEEGQAKLRIALRKYLCFD